MIYEARLSLDNPEIQVTLDIPASEKVTLTIINPSPFTVIAAAGAQAVPITLQGQPYIVPSGNTMTVPVKAREFGFRMITVSPLPASITPPLIFFTTADETPPSYSPAGGGEVTLRQTYAAKYIHTSSAYAITSSSWMQLDDSLFFLDIEAPRGEILMGFNCGEIKMLSSTLYLGVFDSLGGDTITIARFQTGFGLNPSLTFPVKFTNALEGRRNVFLRFRLEISGSGWVINPMVASAPRYHLWAAGL